MKAKDIIGDYQFFIKDLLEQVKSIGIDIEDYCIDHLCYRVSSIEEYAEMKDKLMVISQRYIENIHHDRPIAKFILKEPLSCDGYLISMIELPGPQEHVFFNSGLEHLEMVVGNNFKNFKERYNNAWNGFDDSGLHNQPVYVNLSKNRKVKFHEYSLEEVLKMEKRKFIETNQAD